MSGAVIYWIVCAIGECGLISNYREKKRRAMKKRCVVCGQIIPYTAKVCPFCQQAPGNDLNIYDDDSRMLGGRKQAKRYAKKNKNFSQIFTFPIIALIVYAILDSSGML